jgi:antitoxin CptB
MRELDVLLLRYLEQRYPSASTDERAAFRQLLELPDPEIFGYLVGRAVPPEPAVRDVVASIVGNQA